MSAALEALKLSRTSFPLSLYLTIYTKANHECYINYMEGAKALKVWLGKIELPAERYPEILNTNFKVPSLLTGGYEGNELIIALLGKLNDGSAEWSKEFRTMERAIYFVMSKEVITNVY